MLSIMIPEQRVFDTGGFKVPCSRGMPEHAKAVVVGVHQAEPAYHTTPNLTALICLRLVHLTVQKSQGFQENGAAFDGRCAENSCQRSLNPDPSNDPKNGTP